MADDQRRCCILGLCCPPGGVAQRQTLKEWLLVKLGEMGDDVHPQPDSGEMVDAWLDELPWKKD